MKMGKLVNNSLVDCLHLLLILHFIGNSRSIPEYIWSDVVHGCLRGNNDIAVIVNSTEDCRQRCIDEISFECLSVNYNDESCQLSNHVTWLHWERREKEYFWSDVIPACIRDNNEEIIHVNTIEECKQRCINERNFVCLSIEYIDVICHLSSVNSYNVDPATDFTEPCYMNSDTAWFAERREEDSPCPASMTEVSPYGSSCTPVCWHNHNQTGTRYNVTHRSHLPASTFNVGTTEVSYIYNTTSYNTSECRFRVTVTEACLSGTIDAITRTSDQDTYVFVGDRVMKLAQDGSTIANGYPKPICAEFPGLPSNLDAAVLWPNGENYFFKGDYYWTSVGTTLSSSSPRFIANDFPGVPSNVDAVIMEGRDAIFFKGDIFRHYNLQSRYVRILSEISDGWPGIGVPVDAAFVWTNGITYTFSGEDYWRYNHPDDRAEFGYPRLTNKNWLGCSASQSDPPTTSVDAVCVPDTCSVDPVPACLGGDIDAITHVDTGVPMGNIFVFRGMMVAKLTEASGDVDYGFPKPICSVFPRLPSNLDAALTWKHTGKSYFFKEDLCYCFSGFQLDRGYPRPIATEFPGIPNNIDAAVVTGGNQSDSQTYFFKDDMVFKFDRNTGTVAPGYPKDIRSHWPGVSSGIHGAFQWINMWTYIFKGDEYFRWDYEQQRVADGYPRQISSTWFGCQPTSVRNICWVRPCT